MNLNKEKLANGSKNQKRKKWIKQRTKYGYSDRDVWSFDSFLAPVIAGGVRQVSLVSGHPAGLGHQQWVDDLTFIAEQFEWYAKEQYSFNKDFSEKLGDPDGDFHKAWLLLEEHFNELWT